MKNKVINELQKQNFHFIKTIAGENAIVLAIENQYYEDDETYYDSTIGCEIIRPHYFGKCVNIVGNKNDVIASIHKHNDQQDILIKKIHFHSSEPDNKFRQKLRRLVNLYAELL